MRSQQTVYRVCWTNGNDAILDEWSTPLRAIVLDTALEHAKKVSKKWRDRAVVWECGSDGNVVRAFGIEGLLKWANPCKACIGRGKVTGRYGNLENCPTCQGVGKVPES